MQARALPTFKNFGKFRLGDYNKPTVRDCKVDVRVQATWLNYHAWARAIGEIFDFANARDALAHVGRGAHFGKIVVCGGQ